MQFNNLRRNILAMLGESWRQTGARGAFSLDPIRSEFADIPESDLDGHIQSLAQAGYINLAAGGHWAELTPKGIDRLKVIHGKKTDEEVVFPKELEQPLSGNQD